KPETLNPEIGREPSPPEPTSEPQPTYGPQATSGNPSDNKSDDKDVRKQPVDLQKDKAPYDQPGYEPDENDDSPFVNPATGRVAKQLKNKGAGRGDLAGK